MFIITTILIISFISVILAFYSLKDLEIDKETQQAVKRSKTKGSIIFYKDKVIHYSSNSDESSSS